MAKNAKIIDTLPDGFITVEYSDSLTKEQVTLSVPPVPPKEDGGEHTEDDVLDHLAEQWPDNEFVSRVSPAVDALKGDMRGVTDRIAARDAKRG